MVIGYSDLQQYRETGPRVWESCTKTHGRVELPATPFPKDEARVSQGAIISNKLLSGALTDIKRQQEEQNE